MTGEPQLPRRLRPARAGATRLRSAPRRDRGGFTLIEVVVAVGITAVLAGFIVALLTNVSGFWSRTSGRLSAESQARYVLDQISLDLQSALYRDDGNTWLAATIPSNTNNTLGLWNTTGTTQNALKPANNAGGGGGSLQAIATLSGANLTPSVLSENGTTSPRFGIAGTWLRFFTTKRGSNLTAATTSAPVAVAYQIVRRATTATANNLDRRYLLHRSEVRPNATGTAAAQLGTLQAGFSITAAAYQPTAGSATVNSPAEIRFPTLNSVIAENVIDFGVRMYVYAPNATTGALELTRIFPATNSDLTHAATLPPRIANADGEYVDCFPEVVDVMVRVLTDEGARLLAAFEANPQRLTAPAGRTTQQYWWDLAIANSQVFTRRVILNAKPL